MKKERKIDQDLELVRKAKTGNGAAFGQLVQNYEKKVLYLAYDLVGDYDQASDIAQDAFIRAYEKLHQFQERARFSTWLYRITVNLAMDRHRRQKRNPHQPLDQSLHEIDRPDGPNRMAHDSPDARIVFDEQRLKIDAALEALSYNQRVATVLKYFHDKTSKEIAEILNCAEATVRIHIFRALHHMKKSLQDYEND